ncbi:MAG TPA: hypothetical protein VID28_12215 [Methylomirabilota bacterium]
MRLMALVTSLLVALTLASSGGAEERTLRGSTVATLTVLNPPVQSARGEAKPAAAVSGSDLEIGDRVVTGPTGRALITFLDGSTVTVEPASDVTVKVAEMDGRDASRLRVLVTVGTVWARVAGWLAGRASLTLESNAYSATAHDGLIGAQQQQPSGTFVCWTRAGALAVTDTTGATVAQVQPGQKVTLATGRPAAIEGFAVNQSTLGVATTGPVLPLVVMPDGRRVAGFVQPGIDVNQVFGSLTAGPAGARTVEVPAGMAGPFMLVLIAVGDGPFTVTVTGRHRGAETYRQEQTGQAHRGQGLRAEIIQTMSGGSDPRTARADRAGMSTLRPETMRPGTVVLSPLELAAARP